MPEELKEGEVTKLRTVTNDRLEDGTFVNTEDPRHNRNLPHNTQNVDVNYAFVPWANCGDDLAKKHFKIELGESGKAHYILKFIFQHGDSIYSAKNTTQEGFESRTQIYYPAGDHVELTITQHGKLLMTKFV